MYIYTCVCDYFKTIEINNRNFISATQTFREQLVKKIILQSTNNVWAWNWACICKWYYNRFFTYKFIMELQNFVPKMRFYNSCFSNPIPWLVESADSKVPFLQPTVLSCQENYGNLIMALIQYLISRGNQCYLSI